MQQFCKDAAPRRIGVTARTPTTDLAALYRRWTRMTCGSPVGRGFPPTQGLGRSLRPPPIIPTLKVLLVSPDRVAPKMAGPGIRYVELGRALGKIHEVRLAAPPGNKKI